MDSVLINGEAKNTVSSMDRGLQFGDGLFETLAVVDGDIKYWSFHWQRLTLGCERLFLPVPDEEAIKKEIYSLLKKQTKQVIKLIYTRGESVRGYRFTQSKPTRIILQSSWPEFDKKNTKEGIELYPCVTKLSHQPLLAGLKHLNRLENVLARNEWNDQKIAEGLLLDIKSYVIEGTMSNLFMVKNGILYTPGLTNCGVAGVTRQRIICQEKNVNVCNISMDRLVEADEVFMCNSLIGIWPVNKISETYFSTEKKDNPVTRYLQQKINA